VGKRFDAQVALVAGGTGGLGSAVAQALLAEGAQVSVTYRRAEEFAALQQAVGAAPLTGTQTDVTDLAAAEQLIADIVRERGRLDILVNAVGGYVGAASLWQADPTALERMLSLNLRSGHALRVIVGGLRPLTPWMICERVFTQRRKLTDELFAHRHRKRGGHADMVKHAMFIVEAEQQRADGILAALVPAKPCDDTLGGARMLHLHHRAFTRLIDTTRRLGNNAI